MKTKYLILIIIVFTVANSGFCNKSKSAQSNPSKTESSLISIYTTLDSLRHELNEVRTNSSNYNIFQMNYTDSLMLVVTSKLDSTTDLLTDIMIKSIENNNSALGNKMSLINIVLFIGAILVAIISGFGIFYINYKIDRISEIADKRWKEKEKNITEELGNLTSKHLINTKLINAQTYLPTQPKSFSEVKNILEEVLRIDDNVYLAHQMLGLLYHKDILNNPEKAISHNRRAIKIDQGRIDPFFNLLVALMHANRAFSVIEVAYRAFIQKNKLLTNDEYLEAKAKLFFSGHLQRENKLKAKKLTEEALKIFRKYPHIAESAEWIKQGENRLREIDKMLKAEATRVRK
ncbi:MAG: hypothetical protein P9X24_11850 [Candidatus Hatepunaea meridiana]|nr:hypothetical protein [Candidatus Hatepunaea meridiana]